jgi:ParB family chromosome partitioning protein
MPAKSNKGLGKGLGELFGDAALPASNDFEYVQISKIEPRREQPRDIFDPEPLDELADSIREHGVLQPLTVRAVGDGFYQIIAGERRWRAARIAGLTELPARVVKADDRTATELALVENLQREDLNPIEEAAGYRALMTDFSLTQDDVARRMGKSRPHIANSLRLLSLPETLTQYVKSGQLASGSARALLAIKDETEMLRAAQEIIARGLNVREVERMVKKLSAESRPRPTRDGTDINYLEELERELTRSLGRKVKIVSGRNKGKVEIEYYGNEDLELLLTSLAAMPGGAQ